MALSLHAPNDEVSVSVCHDAYIGKLTRVHMLTAAASVSASCGRS